MKKIKLISFLLALMMLLSACGQPNENAIDNDKTDTENKIEDEKLLKEEIYEKEVMESKRKAARLLEESIEIKTNPTYKLQNY